MTLTHNLLFLIASIIVAVAAMFVAFDYVARILRSSRQQTEHIIYGAVTLGLGIWCTQFNGLLSLEFPHPVIFNIVPTLLSLLIAILASGLALWLATIIQQPLIRFSVATVSLVVAIACSYLVELAAMEACIVEQSMLPMFMSVLVCAVLVAASLWVMFVTDYFKVGMGRIKQLIASVMLGLAVVFQHYIGMGWVSFISEPDAVNQLSVTAELLAVGISLASVLLLMVACKLLINRPVVSIAGVCLMVFGAEFSIGIVASAFSFVDAGIGRSLIQASILAVLLIPIWRRMYTDGKNLDTSRRRAETVLASIGDGVLVTDPKGKIEYLNPIAEQLTGWDTVNAQGEKLKTAFHLWDQETRQPVNDPIGLCLREKLNSADTVQAILRNRNRKASPIEITASPIQSYNKNVGNILVFRDVSAKHLAQKELQQDIDGRKALNQLLHIRSTEMSMDQLLSEALNITLSVAWLEVDKGAVFLMDSQRKSLRLRVHKNLSPEVQSLCKKVTLGQCLCGTRAKYQELVFAKCIDESHDGKYKGNNPHGHYNVPIMLDDVVLGVIVLYLKQSHSQRQQEVEFLGNIASALGVLIVLNRKSSKIQKLAYFDKLTGLSNRAFLLKHFKQVVAQAKRNRKQFAVLFLDLDRFKAINDTLGHHFGDEVLKEVARRLQACVRKDDFVARLGGDEFVILLTESRKPGSSNSESALKIAQKILKSIKQPFSVDGHEIKIGTSIGVSVYPENGHSLETLLQNADAAMYYAKEQGRNNFQFYSESMNESLLHRLELEAALHRAGQNGDLQVHYQPQVDMETNMIVGAEALLRWNDPKMGVIHPTEFIPIAEESDLIIQLGEWVLEQVCIQIKHWEQADQYPLLERIAINTSLKEIQLRGFASGVFAILDRHGVDPAKIELELTESALADDSKTIRENMQQLQAIGVKLALDDFGTGYSSFGRLKDFPVDSIKIDRSFVKDMTSKQSDAAIAKAIVAMAHSLDIKVLAEGVETPGQLKYLDRYGCDLFQGFYCAPALNGEEFVKFVHKRQNAKNNKIA
jgi:diguanylate cyclase (GGDEF)-like protein/PAS domain S-box-containing protein